MDGIAYSVFMVGKAMLTSGALKCLACWREEVAMDKGCCPSGMQDVNVLVVNALDGRVGPVQN